MLTTSILVCLFTVSPAPAPATGAPAVATIGMRSASATLATEQKVIRDPAEYNAYLSALNEQDPVRKAAAMEAFVTNYPDSVVKIDALEQAMAAYQQSANTPKVESAAQRIIALDPNNVRALAILAYILRTSGQDPGGQVLAYAQRGLAALSNWTMPEGMTESDFAKLKSQMSLIFFGAAGFGHLEKKQYSLARDNYLKALQIDSSDLQNTYQLSLAELEMSPVDLDGFWYAVKAANLAKAQNNAAGAKQILDYAKARYSKYHGSAQGWDAFVASVTTQTVPPPEMQQIVTRAPSTCELAVQAVEDNGADKLSFSDWEFILEHRDCSPANTQAAAKVWDALQRKQNGGRVKLKIKDVLLIAATRERIDAAITPDNQNANKPDLHILLQTPLPRTPIVATKADVIGFITGYTLNPFMFTMEKGELNPHKELSEGEIIKLLQSGVSSRRAIELVKQYGVDFTLDDETQDRLRQAGASSELLLAIATAR